MEDRLIMKDNGGFSLIEVLISLFIFAIGILAVSSLFDTSYRAQGSAKSLNNANRLVQTYMERASSLGYQKVLNDMGAVNYQVSGSTKSNWKGEVASGVSYRVTVEVQESYPITVPGGTVTVNKALVTVTWTEKGSQRSVQYETYL